MVAPTTAWGSSAAIRPCPCSSATSPRNMRQPTMPRPRRKLPPLQTLAATTSMRQPATDPHGARWLLPLVRLVAHACLRHGPPPIRDLLRADAMWLPADGPALRQPVQPSADDIHAALQLFAEMTPRQAAHQISTRPRRPRPKRPRTSQHEHRSKFSKLNQIEYAKKIT